MGTQQHLNLRLVRLRAPEEWGCPGGRFWFILPKSGAGRYAAGSFSRACAPGDVLVINSSNGGCLRVQDRGELVFSCFSLCFEHLLPLFANDEIPAARRVLDGFNETKLYAASTTTAVQCHRLLADSPPHFDLEHRSHLLRVVAVIMALELKVIRSKQIGFVGVEEHIGLALEKLSSDDFLTLSVGELADKFNCSRRHLSRLFHQHFGFSAAALKMELRLLKAAALLRDPHAKVITVAENCGFNHLGLFNTCFKKRFSASPGQWRKTGSVEATRTQPGTVLPADSNCSLRLNGLCPWVPVNGGCSPAPRGVAQADLRGHVVNGTSTPNHGTQTIT